MKERFINFLTLFTSAGTLVCCAIPVFLSLVVGGVAITGYIALFPWVIPISAHKGWIFTAGGLLIFIQSAFVFYPKGRIACALTGNSVCETGRHLSRIFFWFSIVFYAVGAFTTYGLVPILEFLEG